MKKKDFIKNLLYYIIPTLLVFPLSIWGICQMDKACYDCFFVVGDSMSPTLSGSSNNSTYGYTDNSEAAIKNLQRFDLVICYYPFSSSKDYTQPYISGHSIKTPQATLKVKRVIGLPGDTLDIKNEVFSITTDKGITTTYDDSIQQEDATHKKVPFKRQAPIVDRIANITLGENEYFVMGDNWTKNASTDCCNPTSEAKPAPIYRENIDGVIVKISGMCTHSVCKHCSSCKKIIDEDIQSCSCGSTDFSYYDDITEERPFENGPYYAPFYGTYFKD